MCEWMFMSLACLVNELNQIFFYLQTQNPVSISEDESLFEEDASEAEQSLSLLKVCKNFFFI